MQHSLPHSFPALFRNDLIMARNFICLSISAKVIGMLADRFGLQQAFVLSALSGLIVARLVYFLPSTPIHSPINPPSELAGDLGHG